jgi:hypothetical protein
LRGSGDAPAPFWRHVRNRWPSGIRNSLPPCHNPSGSASRLLRQNNPVRDRAVQVITTAVEAAMAAPMKSP